MSRDHLPWILLIFVLGVLVALVLLSGNQGRVAIFATPNPTATLGPAEQAIANQKTAEAAYVAEATAVVGAAVATAQANSNLAAAEKAVTESKALLATAQAQATAIAAGVALTPTLAISPTAIISATPVAISPAATPAAPSPTAVAPSPTSTLTAGQSQAATAIALAEAVVGEAGDQLLGTAIAMATQIAQPAPATPIPPVPADDHPLGQVISTVEGGCSWQPFKNGGAIWLDKWPEAPAGKIVVLYHEGGDFASAGPAHELFNNEWVGGDPNPGCSIPGAGAVMGFGKLFCSQESHFAERLSASLTPEQGGGTCKTEIREKGFNFGIANRQFQVAWDGPWSSQ